MGKSSIPLLDLRAQYAPLRDEIRAALDRVMDSQRFILGPEVESLEREIAAYSRCAHAIGVSSGTDALLAALMAIDLKPGDEKEFTLGVQVLTGFRPTQEEPSSA